MDLVLQGQQAETPDLKRLAKLTRATEIRQTRPGVFRLAEAEPAAEVAELCRQAQLDWGFIPARRKPADFRLLAMDMDSTLITIECIDEIADWVGVKPRVAAITAAAMRGELDFAQSLQQRVALLAGLEQSVLARVYDERLALSPGAETLLAAMHGVGARTLLVSGGFTFFTDRLKQRLGLDYTASNVLEIVDGRLTGKILGNIVDAGGKAAALRRAQDDLGLSKEQVVAIGDGANDLKMLAEAGVSIAYRAKPVVQGQATYCLNWTGLDGVLPLLGG